jgi:hypothetical protein
MKKITLSSIAILCFSLFGYAQMYHLQSIGSSAPFTSQVPSGVTYNTLIGTSASATNADEVMSSVQTLPWSFNFMGGSYTQYKVSDNGYLTFDVTETVSNSTNTTLPSASAPKAAIFAFWDDLKFNYGSGISSIAISYTAGTAPNRVHIIKWFQAMPKPLATNNKYLIFAVSIKEQGGFDVVYESNAGAGVFTESATVGVQNADASVGYVAKAPGYVFPTGMVFNTQTDDIVLEFIEGVQPQKDISITGLDVAKEAIITGADVPVKAIVRNFGSETVTSVELSYTINGGAAVSATVTTSIPSGASATLTHPTLFDPQIAGNYTLVVSASKPNGGVDEVSANNGTQSAIVAVYPDGVVRKPLYEIFTSSTCGPCTPGNANFHGIVAGKESECTYIKYQQDFPGTGDPYASAQSVTRRNYYAINSIPRMEIDGAWDGNANSFSNALHEAAKAPFSLVKLTATFDKWAQTVLTKVTVEGLANQNNVSIYAAVIETETINNVKSNGESEFLNVFKRFMSGQTGELVNVVAGTPINKTYQVDFKGEYQLAANGQTASRININTNHDIEEFNNLQVLVWVQDNVTKKVLQSTYATEINAGINDAKGALNARVYPNPTNGVTNIDLGITRNSDVKVSIVNAMGQEVDAMSFDNVNAGDASVSINLNDQVDGVYFVNIVTNEGSTTQRVVLNR